MRMRFNQCGGLLLYCGLLQTLSSMRLQLDSGCLLHTLWYQNGKQKKGGKITPVTERANNEQCTDFFFVFFEQNNDDNLSVSLYSTTGLRCSRLSTLF